MRQRLILFFFIVLTTELFSMSYGINLDSVIRTVKFKDEVIIKSYKLGVDNSIIHIEVVKPDKPDSSFFITKFVLKNMR